MAPQIATIEDLQHFRLQLLGSPQRSIMCGPTIFSGRAVSELSNEELAEAMSSSLLG